MGKSLKHQDHSLIVIEVPIMKYYFKLTESGVHKSEYFCDNPICPNHVISSNPIIITVNKNVGVPFGSTPMAAFKKRQVGKYRSTFNRYDGEYLISFCEDCIEFMDFLTHHHIIFSPLMDFERSMRQSYRMFYLTKSVRRSFDWTDDLGRKRKFINAPIHNVYAPDDRMMPKRYNAIIHDVLI